MSIIMDERHVIEVGTKYYTNKLRAKDVYDTILLYCIEHKKDIEISKLFITLATSFGFDLALFEEALNYYLNKYQLVLVHNRNNKFIKLYKNEKVINTQLCSCEENSSECKSLSNEEKQTNQ